MPKPATRKPEPSLAVLAEFKRLFYDARKEHVKAQSNATPDSPAHQAAVAYAVAQKIPGAELLLECLIAARQDDQRESALAKITTAQTQLPPTLQGHASFVQGLLLYVLKRYDEAITCYQQALNAPGYDTPGNAHNNMGLAYADKGEYDHAITCYQQALDTPGFDTPGVAHNNMGLAYADKGEHDRAITCYQQALDTPGYDTPGVAHNNMGLAYADKGEYDRAITCYQKALDTPGYNTPGVAHNNMGLAYADKGEHDRAITCYQQALDTSGYDTPGVAHYNMGFAYAAKGEHDRAITCYQKALDTPGFDTPGKAHNNMGSAYAAKGEHDRAITCYQKALDTSGYDTPGKAHNNMGNAYAAKGEHDRAITCYQKARNTPGLEAPGMVHNNMGSSYAAKGEHDRAITCYQQALDTPGFDSPGMARNNLALSLRAKGKFQEALAEVEKVLKAPDQEGEHQRARVIKSVLETEQAGVKPTRGEEALVKAETGKGQETPEQLILQKLGRQEQGLKDKYLDYLQRDGTPRDAVFSCLRGWGSAVTLLEGGKDCHWAGGGYFLKWQGKGIVIDPGFDFIDNFHDAGYNMREVDAVLVSHNHSDHNYDLSSVDDLRYELHKRWKTLKAEDQQKHDVSKCLFVIDEDTAKSFRDNKADHRGTPLKFTTSDCERRRWYVRENGLPLTVEHFEAEHGGDVPHAVGMRLRLHGEQGQPDFILGYTGDTRYFETLPDHLQGCDVLLAHISMPDEEEYENPDVFKKVHLGYNGLAKLIEKAQPKMVLVGEFWAGLADIRIDLIKGLRRRTGGKIPILPTGLGFHLKLPSLEVECTGCKKPVPHDHIKIAPATSSFGPLGYLCPRCLG